MTRHTADNVARVIMLLNGVMDHGGPFWCYAAIKPSQYERFKAAEAAGKIDLYQFGEFGEIIISAEGKAPPPAVTEKVALMYGTDPRSFFRDIDPLAEIAERMRDMDPGDEEPDPTLPADRPRWAARFRKRN